MSPPPWRGRIQVRDTAIETLTPAPFRSPREGLTNCTLSEPCDAPLAWRPNDAVPRCNPCPPLTSMMRTLRRYPTRSSSLHAPRQIFPDGVTHDNRRMQPFPIYIERAEGAYKWDVDGHRYIDYWMGHGALLLGHSPPHICQAVIEQMQRGTHYGASHAKEVEWGEWVCRLVPCAEMVRFTASGTEATHMALRLARAFTGQTARGEVRWPLPRLA